MQAHWRDEVADWLTVFPGQQIAGETRDTWIEFWVDAWDETVRRGGAPDQLEIWVTVHAFSRDEAAITEVQAIVDAGRAAVRGPGAWRWG